MKREANREDVGKHEKNQRDKWKAAYTSLNYFLVARVEIRHNKGQETRKSIGLMDTNASKETDTYGLSGENYTGLRRDRKDKKENEYFWQNMTLRAM